MNHSQAALSDIAKQTLALCEAGGASAAELQIGAGQGFSVDARNGQVETVEYERDKSLSLTVFRGQSKASVSTTDFSDQALQSAVDKALSIAQFTAPDPHAGLADADKMCEVFPDLDLYHPWSLSVDEAIEKAIEVEQAATSVPGIRNSEGGSVYTRAGSSVYANSHGFIGFSNGTRHSLSATVIAGEGAQMQRDYWYSSARDPKQLASASEVGQTAAKRTLAKLNPRQIETGTYNVLFDPYEARGIWGSLLSAINGASLYRNASFLLDSAGQTLFPDFLTLEERPFERGAMGSRAFDGDGLARVERKLVDAGVLTGYVLSTYAARRLALQSTANAGGVANLTVGGRLHSEAQLRSTMDRGLLITESMGGGANTTTGDFSNGVSGFWIENGEIQYPVAEVTVAGNMRALYQQIVGLGDDIVFDGNIRSGSVLVEGVAVAGRNA